jgi:hypothetical protein
MMFAVNVSAFGFLPSLSDFLLTGLPLPLFAEYWLRAEKPLMLELCIFSLNFFLGVCLRYGLAVPDD